MNLKRQVSAPLCFLLLFFLSAPLHADRSSIAIQAFVVDKSTAEPLNDLLACTFKLYNNETAEVGEEVLFSETQTCEFVEGVFNVAIEAPVSVITENESLFWGITIGNDTELSPRLPYYTTPYAVSANWADEAELANVATTALNLAGDNLFNITGPGLKTSGGRIQLDMGSAQTWTAGQTFNSQTVFAVDPIDTTSANAIVRINPTSSNTGDKFLAIQDNSSDRFTVDKDGNVVISGSLIVNGGMVASGADVTDVIAGTGLTGGGTTGSVTLDIGAGNAITVTADAIAVTPNSIDQDELASILTFADGDLIDLSAILHDDAANQGIKLPQGTALPTNITSGGEGHLYWKTDVDTLYIFDGANWVAVSNPFSGGIESGEITDSTIIGGDIAADTITASNIATGGVGTDEIADGSVTTTDIALDTITAADIAVDAIGDSELDTSIAPTWTGNHTFQKADPSLIFDVATALDTDFWIGVQDDAQGDDDDLLQIGDGTTPGTNPFVTIKTDGSVGIGTAAPATRTEISAASGQFWGQTANLWGPPDTKTPTQALTLTNTQPNGYDPVLLYRQATSTGTIKTAGAIGLLGAASWSDGDVGNQVSDMYFILRDGADTLQERMRIRYGGNVGIGTTEPVANLDILSATRTGTHPSAVKGLYVTGTFGGDGDGVEFRHSNASQGIGFGYNTIYATGANDNQELNLRARGTEDMTLTANSATLNIGGTTGKVGIGTAAPVATLHVATGVTGAEPVYRGTVVVESGQTDAAANGVEFKSSAASLGYGYRLATIYDDAANIDFRIQSRQSSASWSPVLSIKGSNGNVGIGTTTPDSRTQITGGGLCVGSDANCNTDNNTEGVVYSSSTAMTVYDVAENFPTRDDVEYGDIVVLDPFLPGPFVKKSTGEPGEIVIGASSEKPGVLLGGFNGEQYEEERQVAVALTGRIPIKVSLEGGVIERGDFLTPSSIPGVGKKAGPDDPVVGIALEPYDGMTPSVDGDFDRVLTFMTLNYRREPSENQYAASEVTELKGRVEALERMVVALQAELQGMKK